MNENVFRFFSVSQVCQIPIGNVIIDIMLLIFSKNANEKHSEGFMHELTSLQPIAELTFLIVYSEVAMEITDMITMATA